MEDVVVKVKKIIEENRYGTLATASKDGNPWVSPVLIFHDEFYNFYWGSATKARHSQYIKENKRAALVIFDSRAQFEEAQGVYFEGSVEQIHDPEEVVKCLLYRYGKGNVTPRQIEEFSGETPRRLYKLIPDKVWTSKDSEENGWFIDIRVEVPLLKK